MKKRPTIRLAIIGLGHVAQYQLASLTHVQGIKLVAAHDIDPQKAELLPTGVTFFNSLNVLLAHPDVDLVLVSTPNNSHFEFGKKILQKKKSLLLEKPCCDTQEHMDELIGLSQKNKTIFMVALHAMYARDVIWYERYLSNPEYKPGPLTSFHAGFFDPYYIDGEIISAAQSLGGSWVDSGINALSVIGKFIALDAIRVSEGRMTKISSLPCSEIQGSVSFEFENEGHKGVGIIETNWTLGMNRKITQLHYALTDTHVVLDHSNEHVTITQGKRTIEDIDLRTQLPRLTNHYVNLFTDIVKMNNAGESNLAYAIILHKLYFEAMQTKS